MVWTISQADFSQWITMIQNPTQGTDKESGFNHVRTECTVSAVFTMLNLKDLKTF